jgi:hypothetical protein
VAGTADGGLILSKINSNRAMKRILLFSLFCFNLITSVDAQEDATLVFRNTATGREFSIQRGDFVKIKMDEANEGALYKGTFRTVQNGLIYLKGKPGIPIDHIERIRYRPLAMRFLFWAALIIGAIFIEVGFFSVFVIDAAWPQTVAALGLIMVCSSFLIGPLSLRRIEKVQTDWTYDIRFAPAPVEQMAPIP